MPSEPSLPALAKAGSSVAQFYFKSRRLAHFGALGVALVTLFVPEFFAYGLAVVALLIEALAWWLRYKGEHYHRLSRELIRWARLENAFGKLRESALYITDLRHSFGGKLEQKAMQLDQKFYNEDGYYTSDKSQGNVRFLENLQESAFWSKHLYAIAAQRTFGLVGLASLAVIVIVFFIAPFIASVTPASSWELLLTPKLAMIFWALVISDELGSALAWQGAAAGSDEVDRHLDKIRASDQPSQEILLAVLGNYSVATAAAPPIPTHIYESQRTHLNKLWDQRMGRSST